eukprot:2635935-Prymnesium_polylepis.1
MAARQHPLRHPSAPLPEQASVSSLPHIQQRGEHSLPLLRDPPAAATDTPNIGDVASRAARLALPHKHRRARVHHL